ncbi:MAG: LuxR C-terminal-related transcriptional regulator [Kiloniellaceae bacterium]
MRAVIADDHPLYREAVGLRLQRQLHETEIVEVGEVDELMSLAGSGDNQIELILLDLCMPGMKGGRTVEDVVRAFPDAAVVLVSGAARFEDIRHAIDAGARGFLPKTLSSKLFAQAISVVMAGGTFLPAETLQMNDAQATAEPLARNAGAGTNSDLFSNLTADLTTRQQQVLVQLASGATNKEIGRNLEIAEVTVKLHIRQVLRKINARNRAEAASIATRAGLI